MKKSLAFAASLIALCAPALAAAHENHACIDEGCTIQSLLDDSKGGAAVADPTAAIHYGSWGIDLAGMDRSVKPGDDWFRFVSGTWAQNTEIPADRSSYGPSAVLREVSEARMRKLLESYRAGDKAHSERAKAATLYQGFMDEQRAEQLDGRPLVARLSSVYAARTKEDMARLMGQSIGGFGASFFGPGVNDDAKQPTIYALYMRQSGLGLGDRDLYLDSKFQPQRERYQAYVGQMFAMAG
ncbi:MAG: peptidase, partial [Alphaproteobacteria bacterium]|nr:peptidase [Alphaproteobacteria bacterium]